MKAGQARLWPADRKESPPRKPERQRKSRHYRVKQKLLRPVLALENIMTVLLLPFLTSAFAENGMGPRGPQCGGLRFVVHCVEEWRVGN